MEVTRAVRLKVMLPVLPSWPSTKTTGRLSFQDYLYIFTVSQASSLLQIMIHDEVPDYLCESADVSIPDGVYSTNNSKSVKSKPIPLEFPATSPPPPTALKVD